MNKLLLSLVDGGRVVRAFGYSINGLRAAYRYESAFRQELILAVLMIPAGCWLGRNAVERMLLVGTVLLVLVTELLNSAVEAAVDRQGTDRNELAGRAKDMGSAAVLMAMLITALIWGLLLWERFAG
jgi:diacylglycerol kinase (ATP)